MLKLRASVAATAVVLSFIVAACGGGGGGGSSATDNSSTASNSTVATATTFSISGTVTGLDSGTSVVLQNNGKDQLAVSANGSFTFPTAMRSGAIYGVTVNQQPSATTFCTVSNGSGILPAASVTNVVVSCGPAHFAYVTDANANTISQYIYGPGGALTPMTSATVQTGSNPTATVLNPTAPVLYVVNSSGNSISQFSISAGGALTPLSVASVSTGSHPSSMAVDPSGRYAYVPTVLGHSIYQYTIDASGSLTPMATPAVTAGTNEYFRAITIEPTGHYAYVLSDSGIYQFAINGDGSLTLQSPSPAVSTGLSFAVAIASTANNVYAVYYHGTAQYKIDATGLLSPLSTPTVNTGYYSSGIAIDAAGGFVYVPNQPGSGGSPISQYAIGADGALTALAETPATGGNVSFLSNSFTVDATGKYAYAVVSGKVLQYTVGADGALTAMAVPSVASSSNSISIVTK